MPKTFRFVTWMDYVDGSSWTSTGDVITSKNHPRNPCRKPFVSSPGWSFDKGGYDRRYCCSRSDLQPRNCRYSCFSRCHQCLRGGQSREHPSLAGVSSSSTPAESPSH